MVGAGRRTSVFPGEKLSSGRSAGSQLSQTSESKPLSGGQAGTTFFIRLKTEAWDLGSFNSQMKHHQ